MGPYILALDQGTTSSRAIVFDREGEPRGRSQAEIRQSYPHPGWVEHDPMEIWETQLAVARAALTAAGAAGGDVAAIGIANQRETVVLWDRATGVPLAPAIVWQDRRTAAACEALRVAGHAPAIRERSGLVLDAYFSGTKLCWLLDHVPQARARAERGELAAGTIDSWLAFKLTGAHITDVSNASRTQLLNLHTLQWDPLLLEHFQVPREILPEVLPSSALLARTDPAWFGAAIPLAGMAGDQQAATFGQACWRAGMAKNTYGTGCFLMLHTGSHPMASQNDLLTTLGWALGSTAPGSAEYLLEGSVFTAGAAVQWLRDGLGIIESAAQVEPLANQVADTGGVQMVPAFTGLGAPHWDPYARGTLLGLTRGTTRAHIARATLESIACQSVDVIEAMQRDSSLALAELRVDGGASRNDLLMQMQADLLGVPIVRPKITETTALGAAMLAGLATGFFASREQLQAQWREERRFLPRLDAAQREAKLHRWHRALERSRGWVEA